MWTNIPEFPYHTNTHRKNIILYVILKMLQDKIRPLRTTIVKIAYMQALHLA